MSDIVERLRLGAGHEGSEIISAERIMDEAADEIERLRKTAIETMQEMLRRANEIERWQAQSIAQYAEIKRLRGWIAPDIIELTDEMERLRAALHAIANRERPSTARSMARRALEPRHGI